MDSEFIKEFSTFLLMSTGLIVEFPVFFLGMGIFLWPSSIPFSWWIIPLIPSLLFFVECYKNTGASYNFKAAIILGVFLTVFDFIVENVGNLFGFWNCNGSSLFILSVPIEVMFACLIGGITWSLFVLSTESKLRIRFKSRYSKSLSTSLIILDVLFFGVGGSSAEWCLIQRGLMRYSNGWTSFHAFLAYSATWTILHSILNALAPRMDDIFDQNNPRMQKFYSIHLWGN